MNGSTMRSNSVHKTFQRGYVIHGTHWLTARDNVAFNTTGHAFMLEDGIEQNNTLQHNLVINSRPASVSLLHPLGLHGDKHHSSIPRSPFHVIVTLCVDDHKTPSNTLQHQ